MAMSRKQRIKLITRTLTTHEKQMADAVERAIKLVSAEVEARWTPGDYTLLDDSITNFQRKMSSIIFRYGINVAGESGTQTLNHFQTKASMEIMMENIRRWLSSFAATRALTIANYLRTRIQEQVSAGGDNATILANVLRIINAKGSALRIARTETHTALERGAWEAARSLGVRVIKEWAALDDVNTRPDHAAADGQLREIEEPFSVGGELMQYPGDPTASAKQVVNCRCTALYYLVINGEIQR